MSMYPLSALIVIFTFITAKFLVFLKRSKVLFSILELIQSSISATVKCNIICLTSLRQNNG